MPFKCYSPSQTKSDKACPRALALVFQSQRCYSLFLLKSYGAKTNRNLLLYRIEWSWHLLTNSKLDESHKTISKGMAQTHMKSNSNEKLSISMERTLQTTWFTTWAFCLQKTFCCTKLRTSFCTEKQMLPMKCLIHNSWSSLRQINNLSCALSIKWILSNSSEKS